MKAKDYLLWFLVVPVGLTFLVVSLMVYFNKGNSRKLIRAKLKTGAFLLSLSYFSSCNGVGPGKEVMCYDPALPENHISLENTGVSHQPGDTITGGVNQPSYQQYSFAFIKAGETAKDANGWLVATDSVFDGSYDNFYFIIPGSVPVGTYELKIFGEATNSFAYTKELYSQSIEVVDED